MIGEAIEVKDGHPVWIYEDGKESPFSADSALKSIKDLTVESMSRKSKLQEYEAKLAPFADIDNGADFITKAKAALETVKNLDGKKLIDAGEVETLKQSVALTYKEKITGMETAFLTKEKEYQTAISTKDANISNLLIKGAIGRAKFIEERTVLTPSIAYDVFQRNFKIEEHEGEARAVATRKDGTKIMSLKDPGSYAGIDEALETLVNEHPDKDRLLKGIDGGGGATQTKGQPGTAGKITTRSQWDTWDSLTQHKWIKDGGRVRD